MKSLSERAVLPRKSSPCSSNTPLPIWVVMKGTPVLSTNSRSILHVSFRLAPAPITRTGLLACSIIATAALMALYSAIGRRTVLAGIRAALVSSAAMSSGNSMLTAPGRSSDARRKASRTTEGMRSPLTIWVVNLVIGRIMSTASMTWKRPCLLVLIGFQRLDHQVRCFHGSFPLDWACSAPDMMLRQQSSP